jgi:glycosyltransferase 2 family protein
MELGRDHDIPERASGAAVEIFLLVVVGTGLAVAAVTAPLLGTDAVHAYWWLLAALPLVLLAIAPPVLNRLLALLVRLARRPPLPASLSTAGLLRAAGWALASWVASSGPVARCWRPAPPGRSRAPGVPGSGWLSPPQGQASGRPR